MANILTYKVIQVWRILRSVAKTSSQLFWCFGSVLFRLLLGIEHLWQGGSSDAGVTRPSFRPHQPAAPPSYSSFWAVWGQMISPSDFGNSDPKELRGHKIGPENLKQKIMCHLEASRIGTNRDLATALDPTIFCRAESNQPQGRPQSQLRTQLCGGPSQIRISRGWRRGGHYRFTA